MHAVPYFTTVQAARMAVSAMESMRREPLVYRALQDYLRPG
jgi:carbamoyl-phosphate synthase large subunit